MNFSSCGGSSTGDVLAVVGVFAAEGGVFVFTDAVAVLIPQVRLRRIFDRVEPRGRLRGIFDGMCRRSAVGG